MALCTLQVTHYSLQPAMPGDCGSFTPCLGRAKFKVVPGQIMRYIVAWKNTYNNDNHHHNNQQQHQQPAQPARATKLQQQ
eukprot:1799894-Amphidinium_carterae.1